MTELERLLTLQLQQAQEQAEAQSRLHQEETEELLLQLNNLQSAWENSAKEFGDTYSLQQSAFEEHKRQTERVLSAMRQEINQHRAETARTAKELEGSLVDLLSTLESLLSTVDD